MREKRGRWARGKGRSREKEEKWWGEKGRATAYTTLGFENSFSFIIVWLFIVGLGFG